MTVSVMVCDDLPEERVNLSRMLRHYEGEKGLELELETASDGSELLERWQPGRWDIIFLDIYMPILDGVETARRLRQKDSRCEIVFVTTSLDHGMEGYELHVMDYLTKPYTQGDVDSAMDWFLHTRAEKRRELLVRTSAGEEETIPAQELLYIESRGHNCMIHTVGGELSVHRSIDDLAAGLDSAFFRCHKSFLLNLAHVARVEQRAFRLDNGEEVPISAANLAKSKSALLAWKTGMA